MTTFTGNTKSFSPLGLGCWIYHKELWGAERDHELLETMETALAHGTNHLDTATGYGEGASERLVGRFMRGRCEQVFIATKADIHSEDPKAMVESVMHSLERLNMESIDLYYIHWPRSDMDIRPAMEGLEAARALGLIRSVGVSNFSVEQMELVRQVGQIDAHQIPHSLFWRYPEREVIPYCRERGIGVITYGTIAYGILTGKLNRELSFEPGDQRNTILFFQEPTWGAIYAAVDQMKAVAQEVGRPLLDLAIRWSLAQPGIVCGLVGANKPAHAVENAAALEGEIPTWALERLSEISAGVMKDIPDVANPYRHMP